MSGKPTVELIAVLRENWQAEMRGYYTYQTLSGAETDPRRRSALRDLAAAERRHADLWSMTMTKGTPKSRVSSGACRVPFRLSGKTPEVQPRMKDALFSTKEEKGTGLGL